jgi:hypothetical protein
MQPNPILICQITEKSKNKTNFLAKNMRNQGKGVFLAITAQPYTLFMSDMLP